MLGGDSVSLVVLLTFIREIDLDFDVVTYSTGCWFLSMQMFETLKGLGPNSSWEVAEATLLIIGAVAKYVDRLVCCRRCSSVILCQRYCWLGCLLEFEIFFYSFSCKPKALKR